MLGNHRHPPLEFQGIQVVNQVTILGMFFRRNITEEENYALNFQPQLQWIKPVCKVWINSDMSLKGKVTLLIKSLMISLLQYPAAATTTPPRAFLDFLWSVKRSKITYALLIQDIDHGGLTLPELETRVTASLLAWIRHLWFNPESAWATVIKYHFKIPDIKEVTLCNMNWAVVAALP